MQVFMVGNTWLRSANSVVVRRVVVAAEPDAADEWIIRHITEGDICITGDIPLASCCVEKGARVINHVGKRFTEDNIGMAIAMRELKTHLRDTEVISEYNPPFNKQDRSRFLSALQDLMRTTK